VIPRAMRIKRRVVTLPSLVIKESTISGGGLGVFTAVPLKKGDIVTEYGGEPLSYAEALALRKKKEDTHVICVEYSQSSLDGRVETEELYRKRFPNKAWRCPYTLDYYADEHLVGSLLNDPYGSANSANVKHVVIFDERFPVSPNRAPSLNKVFVVATRDIDAGEELFLNYGEHYHELHFRGESTNEVVP